MSKALSAAISRRDAMIASGASAANITAMNRRIERLTPKAGTCTPAVPSTDPMAEYHAIMSERFAMLDRRRARIAALEDELVAEKATLDAEIEAVLNTAPRDELVVKTPVPTTPVKTTVETETDGEKEEAASPDTFADYEPEHVAAVASGAPARFVRGTDHMWFIAARADQIDSETGEVIVQRADGSECVPIVGDAVATSDGIAVYRKFDEKAVA